MLREISLTHLHSSQNHGQHVRMTYSLLMFSMLISHQSTKNLVGGRNRRARCVQSAVQSLQGTNLSAFVFCHLEQPKGEDYVDENGIRTTVEYTVNDEGKKVKVRPSQATALSSGSDITAPRRIDHSQNQEDSAKAGSRSQRCRAQGMDEVRSREGQQAGS